ncbi:MAG: hypothetical protein ACRCX8_18920 [Sarcina sp.]
MAKKKDETPVQICTMCGEEKKINGTNFYKSYNPLFKGSYENRMCVCKSCLLKYCKDLYRVHGSEKKALHMACEMVGSYYSRTLFEQLFNDDQKKKEVNNVFATYFQKINSLPQYKGKTFRESDSYDLEAELQELTEDNRDVIDFWGNGYTEEDYRFLEKEYQNLVNRFECDSYSQEMLFQEISQQRLDIKKKRQMGNSVDKELKTLQDLLGSANIKPVQESASMASDQVTFGTLIKKFENERPIPEPDPEWADVDNVSHYISVWFFGHICALMGIKNDYARMYEEELAKHTVEKVDYEDEDEDELDG